MPAQEPPRRHDLGDVPAFLRAGSAVQGERGEEPKGAPDKAPKRLATPPPSTDPPPAGGLDPASLPMPSLSRRRLVTAGGVLIATLLALSFARQVGEASAASDKASELRRANLALRDEVAGLERDLGHVQDARFILLQARAFGLGARHEIPFALAVDTPDLGANAPGSASVRLGADPLSTSPLDAWLEVLFGPGA